MEAVKNWFEEGINQFQKENYTSAVAAFEKAVSLNQNPVDAWFNRGLAFAQMGQYDHALQSIDKALALDPVYENARTAREMILARIKKQEQLAHTPEITLLSKPITLHTPEPEIPPSARNASEQMVEKIRSPVLAAVFSALSPGWGQWYNGRRTEGLIFFLAPYVLIFLNALMYVFVSKSIIGSVVTFALLVGLWLFGIYNAFRTAQQINNREISFTRKSRLFWLPVLITCLVLVLLIAFAAFSAMLFGLAGGLHTVGGSALPASSTPAGGSAGLMPTVKVVAVSVQKPDMGHIFVTYQGGRDASQVVQVKVTVTDSVGQNQIKSLGKATDTTPLAIGSSLSFTGSYTGKNHVVAIAQFKDGNAQTIYDAMV